MNNAAKFTNIITARYLKNYDIHIHTHKSSNNNNNYYYYYYYYYYSITEFSLHIASPSFAVSFTNPPIFLSLSYSNSHLRAVKIIVWIVRKFVFLRLEKPGLASWAEFCGKTEHCTYKNPWTRDCPQKAGRNNRIPICNGRTEYKLCKNGEGITYQSQQAKSRSKLPDWVHTIKESTKNLAVNLKNNLLQTWERISHIPT